MLIAANQDVMRAWPGIVGAIVAFLIGFFVANETQFDMERALTPQRLRPAESVQLFIERDSTRETDLDRQRDSGTDAGSQVDLEANGREQAGQAARPGAKVPDSGRQDQPGKQADSRGTAQADQGAEANQPTEMSAEQARTLIAQKQARIAEIDEALNQADLAEPDGNQLMTETQERIREQEERIAELKARLEAEQAEVSLRQRQFESRVNQESQLLARRLEAARERIRKQEEVLDQLLGRRQSTIAPETTTLVMELDNEILNVRQELNELRSQYASIQESLDAAVQEAYSDRSAQIEEQLAGQVDLSVDLANAQAVLDDLRQELQQAQRDQSSRRQEQERLRSERRDLEREIQGLQRRLGS